MPCIKIVDGIKIYVYTRDHNPPHFHVIIAEFEELIIIESFETYSGKIPSAYKKKVMQWAKNNKSYILKQWNKLN